MLLKLASIYCPTFSLDSFEAIPCHTQRHSIISPARHSTVAFLDLACILYHAYLFCGFSCIQVCGCWYLYSSLHVEAKGQQQVSFSIAFHLIFVTQSFTKSRSFCLHCPALGLQTEANLGNFLNSFRDQNSSLYACPEAEPSHRPWILCILSEKLLLTDSTSPFFFMNDFHSSSNLILSRLILLIFENILIWHDLLSIYKQ